jgi:hypothetical protein
VGVVECEEKAVSSQRQFKNFSATTETDDKSEDVGSGDFYAINAKIERISQ